MSAAERGSKRDLAKELGVSRASLYYRPKIPERDESLRQQIESVMSEHPGYGYRRVALALGINAKRAQRVMKKFSLKPARRARAPRKRLDEGREARSYPCVISKMSPIEPDYVWVSDFTFINFQGQFLFLATVIDLFTGVPLGFNISTSHDASLVRVAIERAVTAVGYFPEWFHSDQGSEYISDQVAQWLESKGVQISMSPKASPWRNGSQESFFGRFKVELGDPDRFDTLSELLEELFRLLNYFANIRIKNRLRMAPADFRARWFAVRQTSRQIIQSAPELPPHQHLSTGKELRLTTRSLWTTAPPPNNSS